MTGLPELNYPAFHAAANDLRAAGYLVTSPTDNGVGEFEPWISHLRADIKLLVDCDGIATIDGWQQSKGANAEINLFHNLGLPVFNLIAWLALAKPEKSSTAGAES